MATILFNDAQPFEQSVKIPSTEGPTWNLVKIGQVVSESKTFKNYMVLYLYTAEEQGQITTRKKKIILTKTFYYFLSFIVSFSINIYWIFFNFLF